jgi:hypothetical protein
VSATLATLAIVKVDFDRGHDHVENLLPFVAECLRKADQHEVALPEVQRCVEKEAGLRIPQSGLKTVLGRAARKGLVVRKKSIYQRQTEALAESPYQRLKADVGRQYESIVSDFQQFCADEYDVKIAQDDAEATLVDEIVGDPLPILTAAVEGGSIITRESSVEHGQYLASAFIAQLERTDQKRFADIEAVAKGSMLASILYLPDLGSVAGGSRTSISTSTHDSY